MNISRILKSFAVMAVAFVWGTGICFCQITAGQPPPDFTLQDIEGKDHHLASLKSKAMSILYFFDVESRPSQEGLLYLNKMIRQYSDADLVIWGITLSDKEKISRFSRDLKVDIPLLQDTSGVSDLYQARLILPSVCILGPGLTVLDYFQGGGKTTEIMLVRLAERQLQRKNTLFAKALSEEVEKKDPENVQAKTVKGYAALQGGEYDKAEEVFQALSQQDNKGKILGKEGLAAVYAKIGKTEKALEIARQVEQEAPERAFVNVVKGNVLFSQNKHQEAEAEFKKAVQKTEAETFQKAVAYNQYGRVSAIKGDYKKSRELYDQAIAIDPYYIEATSNKGVTYGKEGKWDKALDSYRQALTIDKNDMFSAILAKKAQEMLDLQKSTDKRQRIDKLVKDLSERYRSQKEGDRTEADTWTSRTMVLSFVDLQEKGGLAERDGFSSVLTSQLTSYLNSSGRVQVVERVLVDRLLEELNLGSSELADPGTALKLGKVLAAKLIGTGSLFFIPQGTLLSLRLLDTETSAIPQVITKELGVQMSLEKELHQLNREILKMIIAKYPIQGYIVQAADTEVMLNLGSSQGVVMGTKFEVIEEKEPIEYKGKLLRSLPETVGLVEVIRVEPDLCFARIISKEKPFKTDDKVREKLETEIPL